MATGKSSVARIVATRLGWKVVDSDELIVASAGKEIEQIFGDEGEAAFRRREAAVFADLAGRAKVVVAAGGGAPVYEPTRRSMVEA